MYRAVIVGPSLTSIAREQIKLFLRVCIKLKICSPAITYVEAYN